MMGVYQRVAISKMLSLPKEKREGTFLFPLVLRPELEPMLRLENRRGARNRESAIGREVDHTGVVNEEATLTRATDADR